jgi:ribosomal protein L24E
MKVANMQFSIYWFCKKKEKKKYKVGINPQKYKREDN